LIVPDFDRAGILRAHSPKKVAAAIEPEWKKKQMQAQPRNRKAGGFDLRPISRTFELCKSLNLDVRFKTGARYRGHE
jgi:hypothetical protein